MNNQQVVQNIADQVITAAGGDKLPEEARKSFRETLEAQITRRLGLIIMQNLDDKGLKAYEKLIEESPVPSQNEMQSFLEEYLPDYELKVKAGMDKFMEEMGEYIKSSNK